MKILMGTKNPGKIEGAKQAFEKYFDNVEIEGISVNSDVSNQPLNEEVFQGAKNRVKKLKEYQYESWYTSIFGSGNGIWIGKGVTDQSVLKTSAYNKEMQLPYKNDMGYYIIDGDAILVKYIDFITSDKDDANE